MKKQILAGAIASATALALTGCIDFESTSDDVESLNATLSIDITDAPIDELESVDVGFDSIEIKPKGLSPITVSIDSDRTINLLLLQNGISENLVDEASVPEAEFDWLKLNLDTSSLSVTHQDGTVHDLALGDELEGGAMTVGSQFKTDSDQPRHYVIDFDLRSAVAGDQSTGYELRPALRMVEKSESGHVGGEVSETLMSETCQDFTTFSGSVYAFAGHDVPPFDYHDQQRPMSSTFVDFDEDSYHFSLDYLEPGPYTLAYTCDRDAPDEANDLDFHSETNVLVEAGSSREVFMESDD